MKMRQVLYGASSSCTEEEDTIVRGIVLPLFFAGDHPCQSVQGEPDESIRRNQQLFYPAAEIYADTRRRFPGVYFVEAASGYIAAVYSGHDGAVSDGTRLLSVLDRLRAGFPVRNCDPKSGSGRCGIDPDVPVSALSSLWGGLRNAAACAEAVSGEQPETVKGGVVRSMGRHRNAVPAGNAVGGVYQSFPVPVFSEKFSVV